MTEAQRRASKKWRETHPEQFRAIHRGLIDRVTPWLLDLGSWIFGALIAANLLVLAALLTVGPADKAVLIGTAAFAFALPLDAAGFFLLRLVKDMEQLGLERLAIESFQEAGISIEGQVPPGEVQASMSRQRAQVVLRYSYAMLAVSVVLTVTGIAGTLWHMAWWIGVGFLGLGLLSVALITGAVASSSPRSEATGTPVREAPSP
jgi:hypothetical protein